LFNITTSYLDTMADVKWAKKMLMYRKWKHFCVYAVLWVYIVSLNWNDYFQYTPFLCVFWLRIMLFEKVEV
jgi:hypothetical protein